MELSILPISSLLLIALSIAHTWTHHEMMNAINKQENKLQ
jgi:hypothetical protein